MTTDDLSSEFEMPEITLPKKALIVPLKDLVVFPTMVVSVYVQKEVLIDRVKKAMEDQEIVVLAAQKSPEVSVPPVKHLYTAGTAVNVLQVIKGPKGDAMILVEGIQRVRIKNFKETDPLLYASVEAFDTPYSIDDKIRGLMDSLKEMVRKAASLGEALPVEIVMNLSKLNDPEQLANVICSYLQLDIKEKQKLLDNEDFIDRLTQVYDMLTRDIQRLEMKSKIHDEMQKELSKSERDFMLRQELKQIKKELGEDAEPGEKEHDELLKKVKEANLPQEAEKIALEELARLKNVPNFSPEYGVIRSYVEWILAMPWHVSSDSKIDVKKARAILDEDHYGLEEIKERILEYLSVCALKKGQCQSTIMCFVGPPGVGKTSLGSSVARALGRKFVHFSLGGIKDEAEIRGHRRTYVGAMPGRIIQFLKRAEENDPVFMLDEIDKLGSDFNGDPSAALLEALDPEQNDAFTDHYLDVPFNLSRVLFITTANILDTIPPALLDRMEVIHLPGYTEEEKVHIAHKYLLPKQLKFNGLEDHPFKMDDSAVLHIIRNYTREAGLRNLERKIARVCRKVAKEFLEKKKAIKKISKKDISHYLGVEKFSYDSAQKKDMVGVTTGLAWTQAGGDIIFVEATRMHGNKQLTITGQLGSVMEESVKAALSLVRSRSKRYKISDEDFAKHDLHVHVPEGATPKDGPSAGVTICTSLISLFTGRPVKRDVAMTGEITLTGKVLPIGGLREKVLAAKRARIKTIIIPKDNEKDLKDIPKHLTKGLKFVCVQDIDEVVKVALKPSKK